MNLDLFTILASLEYINKTFRMLSTKSVNTRPSLKSTHTGARSQQGTEGRPAATP